jgi:hypothetical protein
VIFDAWHPMDRMDAETELMGKAIGTYLFRQDQFVDMIEKQLERGLGEKVKCLTITFCAGPHKISDLTLVYFRGGWRVYNDDPRLQGTPFPNLKDLLREYRSVLKYPLYRESSRKIA